MTIRAVIERGDDGTYGVYIDLDENRLGYGIIGDGKTVNEAIEDFYNSYREMEALYKDENKPFQEMTFEFKYDVASFLAFYSKKFTLAGLETITGVSQG
ncbi:type II toxin-antitoxin system HicB family antitoxin [Parabacteroides sp. Marseille-P3160]|uniref:type II toxin-antitoxin system HicB family antitoxin n=1 Tax=Parabacteroides sp. Marseille-P3160 TaxID=1917887 RepID=UPI001F45ED65|nr:DNA-binding protein [Parabacteroides sp. Marseille-P3160]